MPNLLAVPLAVFAVLLMLFTLPVSLPLIALVDRLENRRMRTAAHRTPCVRCGHVLGPEALDAADAAWKADIAEMRRMYPHGIIRVVRRFVAVCTACGAGYAWDKRDRGFTPRPEGSCSDA